MKVWGNQTCTVLNRVNAGKFSKVVFMVSGCSFIYEMRADEFEKLRDSN